MEKEKTTTEDQAVKEETIDLTITLKNLPKKSFERAWSKSMDAFGNKRFNGEELPSVLPRQFDIDFPSHEGSSVQDDLSKMIATVAYCELSKGATLAHMAQAGKKVREIVIEKVMGGSGLASLLADLLSKR